MGICRAVGDGRIYEDLSDQIDGVETTFTTTYKYQAGTIVVLVNGVDQGVLPGPATELTDQTFVFGPDAGQFVLKSPKDTLEVRYLPKV